MQSNISLTLWDVVSYFIPGTLLVASGMYLNPFLLKKDILSNFQLNVILIIACYLTGFSLTILSSFMTMKSVRKFVSGILKFKSYEERFSFFSDLKEELHKVFGDSLSNSDYYPFCLRLITDYCPRTFSILDRIQSQRLFLRNLVIAFSLITVLFLFKELLLSIMAAMAAFLCLYGYVRLDQDISKLVFRTAYVYLRAASRMT